MFKDYKSNYCPQARMSNYVKLWLKTAQLSVSSLGGWRCSSAHVAGLGLGWAATAGAGTSPRPLGSHSSFREMQGMSTGPRGSRRNRGKGENQEGNGTKGPGGSRLHPHHRSLGHDLACRLWGGAGSCFGERARRPLQGLFLPWFSLFSYGSPSQAAREKYAFIFRACLLTPAPLCSSANV